MKISTVARRKRLDLASKLNIALQVRKWQKNAVSKRQDLSKLARGLGVSTRMLSSIAKRSPAKCARKTAGMIAFLEHSAKTKDCRKQTAARIRRSLCLKCPSSRTCRRLREPIRRARLQLREKRIMENRVSPAEISDSQFSALQRSSQRW